MALVDSLTALGWHVEVDPGRGVLEGLSASLAGILAGMLATPRRSR